MVEKQKGKIDPAMDTMKTITPEKRAREDLEMNRMRKDGQVLKFHTPKK